MNNNSIQIERYLQQEMSSGEKEVFEAQLANDQALREELIIQRQVVDAVVNAGVKAEFAKAIRGKIIAGRVITWGIIIVVSITALLLHHFRHQVFTATGLIENKQAGASFSPKTAIQPYINPPLGPINVPLFEYNFDAGQGDTIFYPSGSIIYFPPASLLDESGNPVKGMVRISYREFTDPLDFFVSGIPMEYDSAGGHYNFESSGMCEINAYKDGKALFINQQAKPQISLSTKNKDPLHNLYVLDTVSRSWKYMGKDTITAVNNTALLKPVTAAALSLEEKTMPHKPIRPARALDDKPSFSVQIDPGSFEELFAYDRLKFQVEDESSYRRSDANEHWDNVKLDHTSTAGIYSVTFTNAKRTVMYKVRPVLEGDDYEKALKIFNQKTAVYEDALKSRLQQEKMNIDRAAMERRKLGENRKAEKEWNAKINSLVKERNQRRMKDREASNRQLAANQQMAVLITGKDSANSQGTEIIRTFEISRLGVWNCDRPLAPSYEVPIAARFIDSLGNEISLPGVAVVCAGFNGLTRFDSSPIRVLAGRDNMLWSIKDGTFYYFTYQDFRAANIGRNTNAFTFRMRQSNKQISSFNDVRDLVAQL